MTHQEKIDAWIKAGQIKVNSSGKVTGTLIPMISVGLKQPRPAENIPPKVDKHGQPALELFPRNQVKEMQGFGWQEYTVKPVSGAEPAKETPKAQYQSRKK